MNLEILLSAATLDRTAYTGPQGSITSKAILSVALFAVGLYSLALRRKIAMLGNAAMAVTMVAMFLVWRPDDANRIASLLGIGRGVDLILYCWVIISMMMILNLHLKLRIQSETMTEMVRHQALTKPFYEPPENEVPSRHPLSAPSSGTPGEGWGGGSNGGTV